MRNNRERKIRLYLTVKNLICLLVLVVLISAAVGCSLERDEHTVQFQQLKEPNEVNDDLPVWLDVYSKSVVHDVYSPQGNVEVLP
ncbi:MULTISPECIES: hypothetical protein [Paenibacillus]|uniref:hypothetical protein n=1 Tax=Paenibacillus TaxID=44249 RepID=UPI0004668889|nr:MULTISPECIES: hypothetical protein [Paenibacillus]KGP81813.1 hypothetical protein P364_0115790 [Paenibacillus sp. MAEPY2]KGP86644.1 hypothetical protein P363_0116370 [Paenibacillus sp. MAEPY1]OZQ63489.1 hypothetical protein CA599_24275 [Paenibacillus taichungensis]HBU85568.1 hypothetical protein [Paenibacillus sp.]